MATNNKTIKTKSECENIAEDIDVTEANSVLNEINASVTELSGNSETIKDNKVIKDAFALTDRIPCKSLFLGKLVYTSPTNGARYIWKDFGSVEYLPFGELQTMNNHKPQYLNKPYILLNDPKAVNYFNLTPIYEKVANINKLDALFNSGDLELIRSKIKEAVDVGMKDAVISKAMKMREDNTLVDINIIKILKEELKFDIE